LNKNIPKNYFPLKENILLFYLHDYDSSFIIAKFHFYDNISLVKLILLWLRNLPEYFIYSEMQFKEKLRNIFKMKKPYEVRF